MVKVLGRILANTKKTKSGCHEWKGYRDKDGYGQAKNENGVTERCHRITLRLSGTPVGKGDIVLHGCDNPPCCNPEHLSVGTTLDNYTDMVQKGRQRGPKGSSNRGSKLTERKVRNIREVYSQLPKKELAKRYKVSVRTIDRVLTGETW